MVLQHLSSPNIFCYHIIMAKAIFDNKKSRGRPATGQGVLVGLRLQPEMLAGVDQIAAEHEVTRPEAVRLIIQDWMKKHLVIRGE